MERQITDVLLIDDDPDICIMLKAILHAAGYAVQYSSVISQLPQILHSITPRLILMDMRLAGKDGAIVCRSLKTGTKTKDILILMMSAHPDAESICKEAGADGFLAKPFDIDQLLGKIKTTLGDQRQH
jgi:DNA-binding response OmpR family regulator